MALTEHTGTQRRTMRRSISVIRRLLLAAGKTELWGDLAHMTLRQFADRYGATAVIVVALALLVAILPATRRTATTHSMRRTVARSTNRWACGQRQYRRHAPQAAISSLPSTAPRGHRRAVAAVAAEQAAAASGLLRVQPSNSAPGPTAAPTLAKWASRAYMPPCAQWNSKDNGGTTYPGRDARTRSSLFASSRRVDPATHAILEGAKLADDPAVVKHAYEALFTY